MLLVLAGTGSLSAQAENPRFEFVSLRRVPPLCRAIELSLRCQWQAPPPATLRVIPEDRLEVTNQLAIDLVRLAYGLESISPKYLSGGPDWLRSERYDIVALTGDDGRPGQERGAMTAKIRLMLRGLLEDRFMLRVRIEPKATSAGPPGAEGVRALARKFIREYLEPGDLLAVVHGLPVRGQGLTSDKERLLAAVERYRPPPPSFGQFTALYQTVKQVAVSLGAVAGRRKSIIIVGEGENLWLQRDDIHDRWAYVRDATRTAAAFNVPIHTIRPRGMVVPQMVTAEFDGPPRQGAVQQVGFVEEGRRLLSEDTNGLDLGTVNSADKGFGRIVAANTRYYILGYYSSLERDGKNHPITVRVKRRGADVSARRGVRTLRPSRMPDTVKLPRTLSNTARDLLGGREAAAPLPLDMSVEILHGADFKAALLVHAGVNGLNLDLSPGRKLEFTAAAVDSQGIVRAFDRRAFTLNVRDETRARLQTDPLTFFSRLELPAGRYTVRVSAHQPGGATGFQSREIEIPDFAERVLNISNVLIASAARPSLILQPDETIRRTLAVAPTLAREFLTSETLGAFVEIFDSHWPLASETTVTWSIARGEVIAARGEQTIEVERGGMGYLRAAIPLAAFTPGDYVLHAEVRSTVGPPAVARTSRPFQVVRAATP